MITVPVIRVQLKLDISTVTNHTVPPHELALLTIKHGKGNVVVGEVSGTRDINLEEEYNRLSRRHGVDKESKRRWADVAFGRLEEGRFERTVKEGAAHYMPKESPQKKAAATRKANKAKKDQLNVQDTLAAA